MRAAWFQFRVGCRSRWRAWTAIGILAGVASGVVMVTVAGARRTNSSLHRVVVDNRASDLFVGPNNGLFSASQRARIEHLPQVAEFAYVQGVAMAKIENGKPDLAFAQGTIVLSNADGHDMHTINRPGVVAGRIPRPDESRAFVVNEAAARRQRLHVGSKLRVGFADVRDLENFDGSADSVPKLREFSLTVVGIVRPLIDATRSPDDPRLSPTFGLTQSLSENVADLGALYDGLFVRLHDSAQIASFEAASQRVVGSAVLDVQELHATIARSRRAIRPYVLALWLFGGLALLAGTAVIGQLVTRQRRLESASNPALRALGATRAQLVGAAMLRGLFVGLVSTAVAVVGAIVASPLMPIGPLRILEPHRGVDVDITIVLIGAVAIVFGMTAHGAVGALRRPRAGRRDRHRIGDAIAGAGAPAPVVAGVRLAFDPGRGEAAIPVASTMFGVGLAVAALVATLVYASALTHFTSTPRLYGWVWSYQVEPSEGISTPDLEVAVASAKRDPLVRAAAIGGYGQLVISGKQVGAIAVQPGRGYRWWRSCVAANPAAPTRSRSVRRPRARSTGVSAMPSMWASAG